MKMNLTWSKGLFSSRYQIYSNGKQLGNLTDKPLSRTTKGMFNGKEYLFRNSGFFKQHTEIIDCSDNKVIGRIDYNSWRSKATITVNGRRFNWKYDNLWSTRWSISDSNGTSVKFTSSTTKGHIDADTDNGLLILYGLFIKNYYLQVAFIVILVAVIIPAIG
ncbi:MAG: hypothetical protein EA393_13050 [Bacteroidetes bacterium]|nr:MAG: hypothetical protein EA393_13050 [Bacteroidota bacterium]